jgi:TRAP-type C4-dicarboxylate transport system permease small subunit
MIGIFIGGLDRSSEEDIPLTRKNGRGWIVFFFKNFEEIFGSLILISIICAMFLEVVFRYCFRHPFLWTDEFTRLALIWMTFIGIVVGIKRGSHITIDFLVKKLPGVWQAILGVMIKVVFMGFCVLIILNGYQLTKLKIGIPTPALEWSWGLFYLPLVVSGVLVIFWILVGFWSKQPEKHPNIGETIPLT